jgi:hypothetical protein
MKRGKPGKAFIESEGDSLIRQKLTITGKDGKLVEDEVVKRKRGRPKGMTWADNPHWSKPGRKPKASGGAEAGKQAEAEVSSSKSKRNRKRKRNASTAVGAAAGATEDVPPKEVETTSMNRSFYLGGGECWRMTSWS